MDDVVCVCSQVQVLRRFSARYNIPTHAARAPLALVTVMKTCSQQHTNWTELNKSTKRWLAMRASVTTYFVLIGYRRCSRTARRLVLNTCIPWDISRRRSRTVVQHSQIQFSSCAVDEPLVSDPQPAHKSWPTRSARSEIIASTRLSLTKHPTCSRSRWNHRRLAALDSEQQACTAHGRSNDRTCGS